MKRELCNAAVVISLIPRDMSSLEASFRHDNKVPARCKGEGCGICKRSEALEEQSRFCGLTVCSARGGAGSPLPALQATQAPRLLFAVQHLEKVTLVGLQPLQPVGTVRYGYDLQGRGRTTPLHPASEIWWSAKVPGEQHLFPLLHCHLKGILPGGGSGVWVFFGSHLMHEIYKSTGECRVASLGASC